MNPGLVCLHNFPKHLQTFTRPDGQLMDLASIDIVRSRELGVPRYTEFLRLLHQDGAGVVRRPHLQRRSGRASCEEVYDGDLDSVDLLSGMYAEDRPEGFAFSDTAFRIFILMASRRLNSDRFFTDSFTAEVYTPEGLAWVEENTMGTVLKRHCPASRRTSTAPTRLRDLGPTRREVSTPRETLEQPTDRRSPTSTHASSGRPARRCGSGPASAR